MRFRVECAGSIVSSSSQPFRTACSLRRTSRSLVRMVHARSGRQRPGFVVQSGSIMGALWIGRRRSDRRCDRRLASSCRKNRRPGERPVDRSKWQRRWRRQGPSEIVGRCYRIQKCICSVLGDDSIWHAESGEYVTRLIVARHVLSINRSLTVRRNAIRLGGYPGRPPSRSTRATLGEPSLGEPRFPSTAAI